LTKTPTKTTSSPLQTSTTAPVPSVTPMIPYLMRKVLKLQFENGRYYQRYIDAGQPYQDQWFETEDWKRNRKEYEKTKEHLEYGMKMMAEMFATDDEEEF
jgi:hypothetical protein